MWAAHCIAIITLQSPNGQEPGTLGGVKADRESMGEFVEVGKMVIGKRLSASFLPIPCLGEITSSIKTLFHTACSKMCCLPFSYRTLLGKWNNYKPFPTQNLWHFLKHPLAVLQLDRRLAMCAGIHYHLVQPQSHCCVVWLPKHNSLFCTWNFW